MSVCIKIILIIVMIINNGLLLWKIFVTGLIAGFLWQKMFKNVGTDSMLLMTFN